MSPETLISLVLLRYLSQPGFSAIEELHIVQILIEWDNKYPFESWVDLPEASNLLDFVTADLEQIKSFLRQEEQLLGEHPIRVSTEGLVLLEEKLREAVLVESSDMELFCKEFFNESLDEILQWKHASPSRS